LFFKRIEANISPILGLTLLPLLFAFHAKRGEAVAAVSFIKGTALGVQANTPVMPAKAGIQW